MADGTAEISVTDTGVGIAPEDQEAVFEEFRQVGTAYKKVEGTGLGILGELPRVSRSVGGHAPLSIQFAPLVGPYAVMSSLSPSQM